VLKLPTKIRETLRISGAPKEARLAGGIYYGDIPLSVEKISEVFGISIKAAERMQRTMRLTQ
jgi:hypothetical protein